MTQTQKKIAFIKARWHDDIVDRAYEGFENTRKEKGRDDFTVDTFDVPGALEMPLLAKKLAKKGYDAVVAAALVVDGGIYRHDFVAQSVVQGLMDVMLETETPVFSVSLTPHNYHEHDEHRTYFYNHFVKKGQEAFHAVEMVLDLDETL